MIQYKKWLNASVSQIDNNVNCRQKTKRLSARPMINKHHLTVNDRNQRDPTQHKRKPKRTSLVPFGSFRLKLPVKIILNLYKSKYNFDFYQKNFLIAYNEW